MECYKTTELLLLFDLNKKKRENIVALAKFLVLLQSVLNYQLLIK